MIHHRVISLLFSELCRVVKTGKRKMKRGDHLEVGGILLLTLVSQLNPLAGAINILVMMSDEIPHGGSGSQENELLSDDAEGKREGRRKSE